jgi:predicted MFS family arabinose efflux permease
MKQAIRATKLIFLAFGMSVASWAPIAPVAKSRLSLDDAQFGMILLISGIGAILVLPLSSWLVKRFGSSLMTFISGILMFTLLPMLTIVSTVTTLVITLSLLGAVHSVMNIAINAQATTIEFQSKQSLMSGCHCLFSMGNLLGVLLIGSLLQFKWNLLYCVILISTLIAIILFFEWKRLLPNSAPISPSQKPKGGVEPKLFILGFFCFVAFMSEGSMLNWSAEFLHSSLHYSNSHAVIGYALFSIAMIGGRLLGDRIISRFGQFITFQMSCLIEVSGFIILSMRLWPYAELIGFLLIGLGAANLVPILLSSSGKFPKTAPHYALAIVTSFGHASNLISPALVGFLANTFSLAIAFGCIAVVLFVVGTIGSPLVLRPSRSY